MTQNKQLETFVKAKQGDFVVPIEDACERNGEYTEAYPLGFSVLDNAMKVKQQMRGGVRDGDLVVVTGISGMGKTTFFANITKNLIGEGFFPLWFSYEVLIDNLYAKFKEMGMGGDKNSVYVPKKNITGAVSWIEEKVEEAQEKHNVKMIFIDHLDFLSPSGVKGSDQRRIVLGDIVQELKDIAVSRKVIIFLIAHTKKVQGREIEMQDIGESSKVYQIPDFVFSVSRNFEIEVDKYKKVILNSNKGTVRILKNRLTGELPFMNFELVNNIIKPL